MSILCIAAVCQGLVRRERVSYHPFRSMHFNLRGFFYYIEGHICYPSVFPAVKQIIPLTPVRLLVEGRQEKKLVLAGEAQISALRETLCMPTAY